MKETYLFQFETQQKADYWREQTVIKFINSIKSVDRERSSIEFDDAVYYFWSSSKVAATLPADTICLTLDDLYIIIDDPKRKTLPTYITEEGGQESETEY